ncbi:MAG: PEP-CTERM sorting domain-containing protein [Planctomycetaceae bacterium]|nr:PEP-CTERM sorting domain-containing protein [Planctomycetaceae bacterium]
MRTKIAAVLLLLMSNVLVADELLVTFVAEMPGSDSFNGPYEINPFNPDGQLGGGVVANPDLVKADLQFIVKDFDPTVAGQQVFNFAKGGPSDPGVEFFMHTPLLERVEAYTTRIGSNSPQGYSENTKILLPRRSTTTTTDTNGLTTTGFFGDGTLVVVDGVPTSLSYSLGEESLESFDFLFNPSSLDSLSISGNEFALDGTFDLDTPGAAASAPYGFNTTLNGAPGSTVLDTTRGIIQAELDAPFAGGGIGNLLDNKQSKDGQPLSFNPLDGTGTLYHYTLGNAEISAVAVVPEPNSAMLLLVGALAFLGKVRRRNK